MTTAADYSFTEIYVRGPASPEAALHFARQALGGEIRRRTLMLGDVEITASRNNRTLAPISDDFVSWPVTVEVEGDNVAAPRMVGIVGQLLEVLWRQGYDVVAACDFENELPRSGGFKAGHLVPGDASLGT